MLGKLKEHGSVLLVMDQPAMVGALPVAVAREEGVLVAYLPGLAMWRIADLHAGKSKTDARDVYIIAEAARSLPHTLRLLKLADSQVAELTMLCGYVKYEAIIPFTWAVVGAVEGGWSVWR